MKQFIANKRNTVLLYIGITVLITLLSLFLLLINIYEASLVLGISSVFNLFYLLIVLFFGASNDPKKGLSNGKNAFVFVVLRSMIEVVCLALCAVCVYFIPALRGGDTFARFRVLFIALSLIPYSITLVLFYLNAKGGE